MSSSDIKKVVPHISQNEALIFERSQPGRIGYSLPPLDVEEVEMDGQIRGEDPHVIVIRHIDGVDLRRRQDETIVDPKVVRLAVGEPDQCAQKQAAEKTAFHKN